MAVGRALLSRQTRSPARTSFTVRFTSKTAMLRSTRGTSLITSWVCQSPSISVTSMAAKSTDQFAGTRPFSPLRSGAPLTAVTFPNIYVPTTAGLANLMANASPLAKQILAAFPPLTSDAGGCAPNTGAGATNPQKNGLPNPVGCISFFDPATDKPNAYYGRVDHSFSASDRLSFSANIFRESFVDKYGGGGINSTGPINASTINHFHQLSLGETHAFTPRVLNEVTVAHNRHFN